jgi:hypothetical protein
VAADGEWGQDGDGWRCYAVWTGLQPCLKYCFNGLIFVKMILTTSSIKIV